MIRRLTFAIPQDTPGPWLKRLERLDEDCQNSDCFLDTEWSRDDYAPLPRELTLLCVNDRFSIYSYIREWIEAMGFVITSEIDTEEAEE